MQLKTNRIAIIGDVMLDRYLIGRSVRQSPEADVPVLEDYTTEDRLGGAANVALNVAALGAEADLYGVVGDDASGKSFLASMAAAGLDSKHIAKVEGRPTTLKTRVMREEEHLLRVDQETKEAIAQSVADHILQSLRDSHREQAYGAIILQDYNKGCLSPHLIRTVLAFAAEADIVTAVDPKQEHILEYKGCTIFKPNLKELKEICAVQGNDLKSITTAAEALADQLGAACVAVTLGERGILLVNGGQRVHVPIEASEIVDVCGAGDSVVSVLAAMWSEDVNLTRLGRLCNAAGGSVCRQSGVAPLRVQDLMID